MAEWMPVDLLNSPQPEERKVKNDPKRGGSPIGFYPTLAGLDD